MLIFGVDCVRDEGLSGVWVEARVGCAEYQGRGLAVRWTHDFPRCFKDPAWTLHCVQVFRDYSSVQVLGFTVQGQGK